MRENSGEPDARMREDRFKRDEKSGGQRGEAKGITPRELEQTPAVLVPAVIILVRVEAREHRRREILLRQAKFIQPLTEIGVLFGDPLVELADLDLDEFGEIGMGHESFFLISCSYSCSCSEKPPVRLSFDPHGIESKSKSKSKKGGLAVFPFRFDNEGKTEIATVARADDAGIAVVIEPDRLDFARGKDEGEGIESAVGCAFEP